jgi:hypothetical protein
VFDQGTDWHLIRSYAPTTDVASRSEQSCGIPNFGFLVFPARSVAIHRARRELALDGIILEGFPYLLAALGREPEQAVRAERFAAR